MLKVAIQGFTGSYHAIATEKYFGNEVSLVMCDSFVNLFKALDTEEAHCAVMAIENTIAGTILFNYSLLRKSGYKIVGETFLKIEHCLLALPGQSINDIKEVRSHPMALMQCHGFFAKYPHIKLVEDIDTAYVGEMIAKNQTKGVAAIAGEGAAKKFGLEILNKNIEDSERNFTRFLVIVSDKNKHLVPSKAENVNKATLSFSLSHEIGGLKKVLDIFVENQINIMKIQSTPNVGNEWEYFFHVDLTFTKLADFEKAIAQLKYVTTELILLGTYKSGL